MACLCLIKFLPWECLFHVEHRGRAYPGVKPVDERTWVLSALVAGSERYPRLRLLLPTREPGAQEAAHRTIEEAHVIRLSVQDQRRFADCLLNPPKPSPALSRAKKAHAKLIRKTKG
jgi:Protein of unknown function (DUF1778)